MIFPGRVVIEGEDVQRSGRSPARACPRLYTPAHPPHPHTHTTTQRIMRLPWPMQCAWLGLVASLIGIISPVCVVAHPGTAPVRDVGGQWASAPVLNNTDINGFNLNGAPTFHVLSMPLLIFIVMRTLRCCLAFAFCMSSYTHLVRMLQWYTMPVL